MSRAVYLDPGHGGNDPGAVCGGRHEADDNLAVALALRPLLERQGLTVHLSREEDRDMTIARRTAQANALGVDLYISLHRNAFDMTSACGVETWVYTDPTSAELMAAGAVMSALGEVPIQQNRGIKRGNYGVLRETTMPAVLVELGFITNDADNRLFDTHFDTYIEALALGICAALDLPCSEQSHSISGESTVAEIPAGPGGLYRVQVGAFADRTNAERYVQRVRNMGLDAYLVTP